MAEPAQWHVYLVRCADRSLYTGIATDVERRFGEHDGGVGAKYLRGRGPLELVYSREIGSRGAALRAELRIKRLPRARKEALVAGAPIETVLGPTADPRGERGAPPPA